MRKKRVLSVLVVMFIVSFSLFRMAHADLNDGLVAYYPFNGNADDESGNENNGTVNGGITYVEGMAGQAVSLNGTDSYIRIPNPSQKFDTQYTITGWVLTDGKGGVLFTKYSWNSVTGRGFSLSSTTAELDGYGFSGSTFFASAFFDNFYNSLIYPSYTMPVDKFEYISAVYNKGNLKLYINGVSVSEKNIQHGDTLNNSYDMLIGTLFENDTLVVADRTHRTFSGLADELRIYNRALSETEIQTLYNEKNTCEDRYDEGYESGKQACIDDPLSCGIAKYLIFSSSANPVLQSGASVNVYGNTEINKITLKSGAFAKLINFVGNNEVTVEADSTLFNVSRSGAAVTFKDSNGTVLTIPATKTPQTIIFNDITLTLVIENNQVKLGKQVVNLTPSPIL